MSGNSYIDPVGFILSYLTPAASLGIAGMVFLYQIGEVKIRSLLLAASLFMSSTYALLLFGIWFFHYLPGFYLSDLVWWLKPFRLFGI